MDPPDLMVESMREISVSKDGFSYTRTCIALNEFNAMKGMKATTCKSQSGSHRILNCRF